MTVSNFRVTDLHPTSATLRWDWSGANPVGFNFTLSDGEDRFDSLSLSGSTRSWALTNLVEGRTYDVTLTPQTVDGVVSRLTFTAQEPATSIAVVFRAGSPTLAVAFGYVDIVDIAVELRAGAPTLTLAPVLVPVTDIAMEFRAGAPTLAAVPVLVPATNIAVELKAGTPALEVVLVVVGTLDVVSVITANTKLFINQWQDAPKLKAVLNVWLGVLADELEAPLALLARMRKVDSAVGIYLDYIGERLGVLRPYVLATDYSQLFGFMGNGVGWEQGRFAALEALEPQTPLGDESYRQLLRARMETDAWGASTRDVMLRALRHIDPAVAVQDNHDMTFKVTTADEHTPLIMLADEQGALPRPAGVQMVIATKD